MKPLVFLVEDDEVLIKNFKIFLEMNEYDLITAINGKNALEVLSSLDNPPDIIISDILMPIMDGYDFYMKVSENTEWSRIPFFFLSGKTEPDDVRFGKMLGADDYITKPFSPMALLEKISKKIKESREIKKSSKLIEEKLKDILKYEEPSLDNRSKADFYYLFYMSWDDEKGPVILDYFPKNLIPSLNLEELTTQLYSTLIKIYEFEQVLEKNQFIMRIVKDLIDAYGLIDKIEENSIIAPRSGKGTFMVCAITPNFHYLNSERIRDILKKIAFNIKTKRNWSIKEYWEELSLIV
jgi:response regulator RpfG family c-di-GMP phosphodiesterase